MPVFVVELHVIAPIVIPRPPRFLAEQGVMGDGEGSGEPVVELPGPLKLVQILGPHVLHVFLQHAQELEAALERPLVGHVVGADAADVFVHDLLEPLQPVNRQQVAR